MAEVGSAYVSILPSTKGFGGKLSSQIGGASEQAGRSGGKRMGAGMSAGLGGMGKSIFGPLAAIGGAMLVGDFFKGAYAEARESQKVGALTANVIKVTGGAAKVTTGQVGDLAMAISNKTGVDDEAIQSGANLLLTFKNVRNEVGKGSDVFNRATAAAVDLSAAGFGDVAGSSKMLGKALNDPLQGITALGRAGVTFSAGQKKQIEGFVKSGDLLGAQKIIMGEVESQVGGAAAASATAGEKLATTWGNFKETIGTALLPTIDAVIGKVSEFLGFLTGSVGPAMGKIGDAFGFLFSDGEDGAQSFGEVIDNIFGNSGNLVGPMRTVGQVIKDVIEGFKVFFSFLNGNDTGVDGPFREMAVAGESARGVVATLVGFFQTQLIPAFQRASVFVMTQVVPAFLSIVSTIRGFYAVALPIVAAFVTGMMARIGPLMPTIKAVFAQIGEIVVSVMGLIQAVISRVTTVIAFVWSRWGTDIMNFIAGVWSKVLVIVQAALGVISAVIRTMTAIFKGDWSGAWNGIKAIVSNAWTLIKSIISGALNVIGGAMSAAWALIKLGVSSAWGGIKSAVSEKTGELVTFVKGIPARIVAGLGNVATMLRDAGAKIISGLVDGIKSVASAPVDAVKGIVGSIADFLPGSPVKKGPLRVLNNGHAGGQIVKMLAGGIDSQRADLEASMSSLVQVPRTGSLDFASPAVRSAAVGGAGSGGNADLLAEVQGLRADIRALPKTYQMGQRQYVGAR